MYCRAKSVELCQCCMRRVTLAYAHSSSYFFWYNNSSKVVNTTDNTCGFHLVDYLSLLDYDVCQELPRISKTYSVPIFILGKLCRDSGDFDPQKIPELISVSYKLLQLHQYDFLALLHREHDCDRNVGTAHRYNISNSVELIIKINRFGKIGKIFFEWDDQQKRFKI